MSMTDATTETVAEAEEQFEDGDIAAAFQTLTAEVERLHEEKNELEERVDDLEDELDERARIDWEGPSPMDLTITSTEAGNVVRPFHAIGSKADEDDVEFLEERVQRIEDGEAEVIVRNETGYDPLPIESMIAQRQSGTGGLTANEERATIIFPSFYAKAESWGGELKLDSDGVRNILGEKTDKPANDWNTNTIKRTMRQLAKATSEKDEGERSARDDDNLLTLRTGKKRLQLVADRDEWLEFADERSGD
ncbi:hypothetical protein [Halobacterium hubeiense]|uniref:hypothetical protein n=1 Tax=Halobacterium hubeiense TaxID=1407499 RepID=UPI003C721E35